MKAILEIGEAKYQFDLKRGIDLSIPMQSGSQNPNAFQIPPPLFEPIRLGDYTGSVKEGGGVNCENLLINPHGNGTHTECIGHITSEKITINKCLSQFFFMAQLVSITPQIQANGDSILELKNLPNIVNSHITALLIRTLPNATFKLNQQYSGQNPCYLEPALCMHLVHEGIQHLLVDLPSVDKENDNGQLLAHKAFWTYPENPRLDATISEMI